MMAPALRTGDGDYRIPTPFFNTGSPMPERDLVLHARAEALI
jgi:hypothetical protein